MVHLLFKADLSERCGIWARSIGKLTRLVGSATQGFSPGKESIAPQS